MTRTRRVNARTDYLVGQMSFRTVATLNQKAWLRLLKRLARAEVRIEELEERLATAEKERSA